MTIYNYKECVSTGAAGARTRRSLGHHLLHPLILRLLVLCAPADFETQSSLLYNKLHSQIQIPNACPDITYQVFIIEKKSIWDSFFLVRPYRQNNHKWKLPQAADKKLNSQAWNIGMTESYEEIDSSNSLLTVEHHYYLAKGSVTCDLFQDKFSVFFVLFSNTVCWVQNNIELLIPNPNPKNTTAWKFNA